jgi:hypothetical protein
VARRIADDAIIGDMPDNGANALRLTGPADDAAAMPGHPPSFRGTEDHASHHRRGRHGSGQ